MAARKFGKFGELPVIYQTKTNQILAYNRYQLRVNNNSCWYPYGRILSIRQTFFPETFNLVIPQTLAQPIALAIRHQYMKPWYDSPRYNFGLYSIKSYIRYTQNTHRIYTVTICTFVMCGVLCVSVSITALCVV